MVPGSVPLRDSDVGVSTLQQPVPAGLLLLDAAGQSYALPLPEIETILPMAQLSRAPGMPSLLAGFLNLAGVAVPVVRLSRLFGQPDVEPGLYTPLVILRCTQPRLALWVDRVRRIVGASEYVPVSVPETTSLNNCATALVKLDGEVALLLSSERLLLEQEARRLAELTAAEQARLGAWEGREP